ncbi:MAG: GNAT family N-acetyltransferase, partial [Arcanobacterium sp.]|nr:GNAT family N-acetyltransferase [Arcanobacterium sp.]
KNLRAEYKRPDLVMISEEIFSELDRESRDFYGPHWGFSWEFFFAEEPLEEVPGQAEVRFISASSSEFEKYSAEIKEVLEGANPITDALENFSKLDWYAHFSEEGKITSVMGIEYHEHAIHFSGLGTNPLYRGKGYGSAVMVEAINDSLRRGHQAIYFGMWDWNQGARKLYRKLGIDSGGVLILGDSQPFEELLAKLTDA